VRERLREEAQLARELTEEEYERRTASGSRRRWEPEAPPR
jgi:hypothetical protein